jgi:hypothetical protein
MKKLICRWRHWLKRKTYGRTGPIEYTARQCRFCSGWFDVELK